MRILITGATGFAGRHLVEALLDRADAELLGVSRRGAWPADWRLLEGRVALRSCDLTDRTMLVGLLDEWQPGVIYHLAGYAHVGRSFREPDAAWSGNLDATRSLLDAVQRWGGQARILLASSGLIYGEPETPGGACDERAPLRPESPYAASKAAADLLGYQCWRAAGMDVVRARPFNHVGPRQSAEFAVAHFAQQIVEIERGHRPPVLETGDLRPCRDLTDVRDIVRGYLSVVEKCPGGDVYNLGSGVAHSMEAVLDRLQTLAGVRCDVRSRPGLLRDADTPVLRADASKARRELGWSPRISLERTLADVLAYWRQLS
jgi:GDP-4-dehydro-6-deoxy-D-mannose reductase